MQNKSAWCEVKEWTCRRCSETLKGISEFVTHLDSYHVNDCGIVCPVCDKEFPSKKRLKVHMVLHSDKKFTCPVRFFEKNLKNGEKQLFKYTRPVQTCFKIAVRVKPGVLLSWLLKKESILKDKVV